MSVCLRGLCGEAGHEMNRPPQSSWQNQALWLASQECLARWGFDNLGRQRDQPIGQSAKRTVTWKRLVRAKAMDVDVEYERVTRIPYFAWVLFVG